jgi:hypothetical protein
MVVLADQDVLTANASGALTQSYFKLSVTATKRTNLYRFWHRLHKNESDCGIFLFLLDFLLDAAVLL